MEGLDDLTERFDHVAYGVRDIRACLPLMELLGGRFHQGADHSRNRFRWVQFRLPGGGLIELLQPIDPGSFLNGFLDRRGEGIHHLTFKVVDVVRAAERASSLGYSTTGLHLHPDWSEVFLRPQTAHGAVIQLAAWSDDNPTFGETLEQVLSGACRDET
jgi:4-hydroxyphenylpyruvate dioxygenase-like putative hemolysin